MMKKKITNVAIGVVSVAVLIINLQNEPNITGSHSLDVSLIFSQALANCEGEGCYDPQTGASHDGCIQAINEVCTCCGSTFHNFQDYWGG